MPIVTLKVLREKAGLTQEELAQISGVSLDFIKRFESDNSYQKMLTNLDALARAIGCDARDLVLYPSSEDVEAWEGDRDCVMGK